MVDDDDVWPPEQPTSFTPLLLIHHQGHHTPEQVTAMAELIHTGDIGKVALVTGQQSGIQDANLGSHEKFKNAFKTSRTTKKLKRY